MNHSIVFLDWGKKPKKVSAPIFLASYNFYEKKKLSLAYKLAFIVITVISSLRNKANESIKGVLFTLLLPKIVEKSS